MAPEPFVLSRRFLEDRCDCCGACFQQCPVLEWPLDRARAEIQSLVQNGPSEVLARCTGCMACNAFCPTGANPHTLIVSRWEERYRKEGIPARGRLVLPYQKPNLYTLMLERLPEDERALVDAWRENWRQPREQETMLYAGCNMLLQPFLMDSALFSAVPIFGALELCCGEPLYRMGCWDAVKTVAEHVRGEFRRMGFKRLILPCLACLHLFKQVYPEVFGIAFDFEMISVEDWLVDRIRSGELAVRPLGLRGVVHDNCWPKAAGDFYFDKTRELLALLGVEAVEPPHTRERALCCGMCAPAAQFRLRDAYRAAKTRLNEFEDSEADLAVHYCGGCGWLFSVVSLAPFTGTAKPVYHLLELVQMAIGETPKRRTAARARQIASVMALPLARSYLSSEQFHIDDIAGNPVHPRESE